MVEKAWASSLRLEYNSHDESLSFTEKTEATSITSILNKSAVLSCLIVLWLCFYGLWLCSSYWRQDLQQICSVENSIPISALNKHQEPPQCLYSAITTLLQTLHDFYSTSLRHSMIMLVGANINRAMPSFRGFRFVLVQTVSDGTE